MENIGLGLLPLFTILVIVVSYKINLIGDNNKKKGALVGACCWGGGFLAYGVADYLLLGMNPF